MKPTVAKITLLLSAMVLLLAGLTSCRDDFFDLDGAADGGSATVTATIDFMPVSGSVLKSRASTDAPAGDAVKDIRDLVVLVYDTNSKFVRMQEFKASDLTLEKVTRKPADTTTGELAEAWSWRGSFDMELGYGRYYIYAVANLGRMNPDGTVTSTMDELEAAGESVLSTVSGLRSIRRSFDADNMYNNSEMFGYFTNGDEPHAPSDAECEPIVVGSPKVELHSWLRRSVSKVTVDFDPSGLKENIRIYVRRATRRDVPAHCPIGYMNVPADTDELLRIEGMSGKDYNVSGSSIGFGDFIDGGDSDSDNYEKWPVLMKASGQFPAGAHAEDAPSLFLYENMQGTGKDKRQFVDDDGLVADRDIVKDNKPYGSYVEVEAYYQNLNAGSLSQGRIVYRFMLGLNVIDDYNVMRNTHYKLTMSFRGNANDVDWHIEYTEPEPVVVPAPYYISYLYNHEMVLPLRMTPPDPNKRITSLKGVIMVNRWWPEADENQKNIVYFSNGSCDTDAYANRCNGFLSLVPSFSTNLVLGDGITNYYEYNYQYYYGRLAGTHDRSQRQYPVDATQSYSYKAHNSSETRTDVITVAKTDGSNSVEWGIPMYTRAKSLVVNTGYTGNNPYVGHFRVAKVLFTAELNNDPKDTMQKEVTIRQVERIVNPKGVYRKWNSREPFHVRLKTLKEETDSAFLDYRSDGPWRAYIVRGDTDFIDIGSPGNKSVKGQSGSFIDFNIRFRGTAGPTDVKNCVIRIEYNNYSCVHLIFVRQGYEPEALFAGGAEWYVANMLGKGVYADNPCDEGSMFKFTNWDQPIDVGASKLQASSWANMDVNSFVSRTDPLKLYSPDGLLKPAKWSDITHVDMTKEYYATNSPKFDEAGGLVAQVEDFEALIENCEQGFGVLYADGSSETADTAEKAYGYNRALGHTAGYGMRGVFVYNAAEDSYGGRNIFFPIGFTGYGQRKDRLADINGFGASAPMSGKDAVLRYAASRFKYMEGTDNPQYRPMLWDQFRKPGAIYWARNWTGADADDNGALGLGGLDINYFNLDFNLIDMTNLVKYNKNYDHRITGSNACFIRCIRK